MYRYDQSKMRGHLVKYLEAQKMERFPSLEKGALPPVKREDSALATVAVKCQKVKETWLSAVNDTTNGTTKK